MEKKTKCPKSINVRLTQKQYDYLGKYQAGYSVTDNITSLHIRF